MTSLLVRVKGGAGSGNWGHAGRLGLQGGSAPRGSGAGSTIDFSKLNKDERREVANSLSPEDKFKMYHGMRYIDEAVEVAKNGLDPGRDVERGRIYGGHEALFEGYHISPDFEVANGFGPFVFEFTTAAYNMEAPPGTHWDIPSSEAANEFWRSSYPKSFKPALSHSLALAESQGLLVKPVKSVQRVWMYDRESGEWKSSSPEKFVQDVESGKIR